LKDKDNNSENNQTSSAKNETICAVVVTYNRKKLLLECLEALRKQTRPLDAVYIIDNTSTDNTPEILLKSNYLPKLPPPSLTKPWEISFSINNLQKSEVNSQLSINIHYVRMHENTGGAGGFYEGVKRGYEKGYDWLWLMDDDGLAEKNTLEQLLSSSSIYNLKAIGSTVICRDNKKQIAGPFNDMKTDEFFLKYGNNNIIYNTLPAFNDAIYHKSVIDKVGYPDKNLFIWGDEDDFRNRVKKYFNIGVTTSARYYHPQLFNWKEGSFLIFKFKYAVSPTWKVYYQLRNHTYLSLYKKQKYNFLKELIKQIIIDIKYRKDNKVKSIYYHFKAVIDGITKKLGKSIDFIM